MYVNKLDIQIQIIGLIVIGILKTWKCTLGLLGKWDIGLVPSFLTYLS
jgi:hypothetical protein